MNIKFKQVHMENFLSFKNADFDLTFGGYNLVKGINQNPDDLAASNGSGKSSVFEAINWCLTGETIRGSKDVSNINTDNGALVSLSFSIDNNCYEITRTKEYKPLGSSLKIIIDGEDRSGKGIRDTEKLLEEYLPDISSSLIGSVVILGQGLPQRFTNNTPSGRKEVLEKLSKSDFMIADLKERIKKRSTDLSKELRVVEDTLLSSNTKLDMTVKEISNVENSINNARSVADLDAQINQLNDSLHLLQDSLQDAQTAVDTDQDSFLQLTTSQSKLNEELHAKLREVEASFSDQKLDLTSRKTQLSVELSKLEDELRRLQSITDTCPTCGQKLQGVEKPDTSSVKHDIIDTTNRLDNVCEELDKLTSNLTAEKHDVDAHYASELNQISCELSLLNTKLSEHRRNVSAVSKDINDVQTQLVSLNSERNSIEELKERHTQRLSELVADKENLENLIVYNNNKKSEIQEHIDVVNKMNTTVTRDFRGYLLTSVISYIDSRAKDYCQEIFETKKISFNLDGNNISISYDGKEYEQLSGGEKQKVDIIIQFSIRDMLCSYLNFSSNILVLDEVMDNLDSLGCQKVINLISRKLNDVDSIFIITHHADISIPVDNEVLVVKGPDRMSSIQYAV